MKFTNLEKTLRYSMWGILLLLPFEEMAATVFLLIAAVSAVIICIKEKCLLVKKSFVVLLLSLILCIVISLRFSPDVSYGVQIFLFTIFRYALAALAAGVYVRCFGIKEFMLITVGAACISVLYGYWQVIFHPYLENKEWIDAEKFGNITIRIFGTWGNPNIFGGYLLFAVAAALISASVFRVNRRYCLAFYAITAIFIITIFLTFSRGVWLALFAMLIVLALQYGKKKILVIVLPFLVAFSTVGVLWQRLQSAFTAGDSSSVMRLALWTSTEKMIMVHPIFGWGWGLYWFYYPQFDYLLQTAGLKVFHAHNTYLHYAAEIGVVGLVIFLAILTLAIYYTFVCSRVENYREYRYLMAVFIAFAVLAMTDHVLFNTRMSILFWLFLGIAFSKTKEDK
ncbi:MAG: O-antigen ligase family protein [Negativicutes bacterium]|jgi:putative inorganic carbon (HCO3(-)) transporter